MSPFDREEVLWVRFLAAKNSGDERAEEAAHDAWADAWRVLRLDVSGAW